MYCRNRKMTDSASSPSSSKKWSVLDRPAQVLRLPLELLSTADLSALCLTCRGFRALAESLLYAEVRMTWEPPRLGASRPTVSPLPLLLRSILARPELATYIRKLILRGNTPPFRGYWVAPPKIVVVEADICEPIAFIKRTRVPYSDEWIQELRNGTMDAFLAILIAQLTSLNSLHIGPNFAHESYFTSKVLMAGICGLASQSAFPCIFDRLQRVSFGLGTEDRFRVYRLSSTHTINGLPFFYLPAILDLATTIDNPVNFAWPTDHAPVPSMLTSLHLCFVREGHLGRILSATKGLKALSWEWHYREDLRGPMDSGIIDLERIAKDLCCVRTTLTDLKILASTSLSRRGGHFSPKVATRGSMSRIVDMAALQNMEVPWVFLGGWSPASAIPLQSVIPRNIVSLTITDDMFLDEEYAWRDDHVLDAIQSWSELGYSRAATPHLRNLTLFLKDTDDEWGPTNRRRLLALGPQVGLDISVVKLEQDLCD